MRGGPGPVSVRGGSPAAPDPPPPGRGGGTGGGSPVVWAAGWGLL